MRHEGPVFTAGTDLWRASPEVTETVDLWEQGRAYGHLEAELKILRMFGAVPMARYVDEEDLSTIHILATKFGFKAEPSVQRDGKVFLVFTERVETTP